MIEIYCDGSCTPNPGDMRIGVACRHMGTPLWSIAKDAGHGTSNEAEYLAVLAALTSAMVSHRLQEEQDIMVLTDSQLLVRHWANEYEVESPKLVLLMHCIDNCIRELQYQGRRRVNVHLNYVPRKQNVAHELIEVMEKSA